MGPWGLWVGFSCSQEGLWQAAPCPYRHSCITHLALRIARESKKSLLSKRTGRRKYYLSFFGRRMKVEELSALPKVREAVRAPGKGARQSELPGRCWRRA